MYKEMRTQASTPESWAANFVTRPAWQDALLSVRLQVDPRWTSIKTRVEPNAKILDVGCGLGQWVTFLNKKGYMALGLDYSKDLIEDLKQRKPGISWLQSLATEIPLPSESVDAVITWGVVEHDERGPQHALMEIYRVLKPGGYIFATVPIDTPAMRKASQVQFPPSGGDHLFFQFFFTADELVESLLHAGFEVEKVARSSKHFALLFPRLYAAASRGNPLVRDLLTQVLKPLAWVKRDTYSMVMGVGRKISV